MSRVVSVVGATLTGNSGAEAMLSAVAFGATEFDASVTLHVHSYYPSEDREVATVLPVNIHSARPSDLVLKIIPQAALLRYAPLVWGRLPSGPTKRTVQALADSQVLACVAGVSFVDGRRPFLAYNVATLVPAMLLQVPIVKLSQAMGPFRDPLTRVIARVALGRVRVVVPRGGLSESSVQSLGMRHTRIHPAPDLAFSLDTGMSLVERSAGLRQAFVKWRTGGRGELVAVSPSAVLAGKRPAESTHRRVMTGVIRHLVSNGYRVVVIPTATRHQRPTTHNNDLPLLRSLKEDAGWSGERVFWAESTSSFADVTAMVHECDALIASRFHAMIAGLSAGIPTLAIGWGHKYQEVLSTFGLKRYALSGEASNEDQCNLLTRIDEFLAAREQIAASIRERLNDVVESSRGQLQLLASR